MFLRNYDNYMTLLQTYGDGYIASGNYTTIVNSGSTTVFADGNLNCKRTDGSVSGIFLLFNNNGSSNQPYFWLPFGLSEKSICLGGGNTTVNYDDYCLSGEIVPNKLVRVSSELTHDADTAKYKKTLVCTYTNSTEADVTIREWGLYRPTSGVATMPTYGNNANCSLVFREVLPNPIVIAPGTTATLTFEIDVPMANHP